MSGGVLDLAEPITSAAMDGASSGPRRRRFPLAVKLAIAFVCLVTLVMLINGIVNLGLNYQEARRAAVEVQQEKARAAAEHVDGFLSEIESQIGWTTTAAWRHGSAEQQHDDFTRLLALVPAISRVSYLDPKGKESLAVSRAEPATLASGTDFSTDPRFKKAISDKIWLGPVHFRDGSEPFMTIAVAHAGPDPGVTVVDVNLDLVWDVVTAIRVGDKGYAFCVTAAGHVMAAPARSLLERNTDLSRVPQVAEALPGAAERGQPAKASGIVTDYAGQTVVSAHAKLSKVGWIVFVQAPLAEAMAPVYAALIQTLALLGLGLVLATIFGTITARRLVVPIRRLQEGAERLGRGDLSERIVIRTRDEVETLADRFNTMATRVQDSHETLELRVEERTRDLNQSLQQQTATADVLKVISRSAFDLATVLDTLIESATRMCGGSKGILWLRRGDRLFAQAVFNPNPTFVDTVRDKVSPIGPDARTIAGRVAHSGRILDIPDLSQDTVMAAQSYAQIGSDRAGLGVPLLRDGEVVGVFAITRTETGPTSDRQIDLVQTLADQAVIAIENGRLFEEVQAQTRELQGLLDELRTAQDRLIQTEKLASLGQLTAGIAHEIKNPLNFVNNFSLLSGELLDELQETLGPAASDDETRREVDGLIGMLKGNLAKVVQHGMRADSIVKNMLLHSRTGSGERRAVDLNTLAEESLNLAYHGARAEKPGFNVTLRKSFDPVVGRIDVYPQEVTRVLLNLISNGFYALAQRQAGGEAGYEPTLSVTTLDGGASVEIRIRDNGTGIPDGIVSRMFDPFFTTKPAGEGTGLGLSLSHDIIVKQHGGTIDVTTALGVFTEFRIRLPRDISTQIHDRSGP